MFLSAAYFPEFCAHFSTSNNFVQITNGNYVVNLIAIARLRLLPQSTPSGRKKLDFSKVTFKGKLRPSQQEVVQVAQQQLKAGHRKLHIVAPPGSGKTVLGLYLWAQMIRKPCLVLSPNSAIQSQWLARTDLFSFPTTNDGITSSNPDRAAWLNSLTYQSVTIPTRSSSVVDAGAVELWKSRLIEMQQVVDTVEAQIWIDDLRQNNIDYFESQFSKYKKLIRDDLSRGGDSISLLHESSRATLKRLADAKVELLILDECHHLLGHWGRVLADALDLLNNPVVVGLTATPPDKTGKEEVDVKRYEEFFGEVDYEVPVPAVVKDGFLAPYQDLAYFVRPTAAELKFIATADEKLDSLIEKVCADNYLHAEQQDDDHKISPPSNLIGWLTKVLGNFQLATGTVESWSKFARRDPTFSLAGRQFLQSRNVPFPDTVPPLTPGESFTDYPSLEFQIPVLDRFVRHYLRRSAHSNHQEIAKEITASLRLLGVQITETGTRPCASPVGRVLAYSQNKTNALVPILQTEIQSLRENIRAVVVADFEKTSAVSTNLESLMDDETGGAIAAFKSLLRNSDTDSLEPILITGSTVLIDDEIETQFLDQCKKWLIARQLQVDLKSNPMGSFRHIVGSGGDWAPRVYVEMITELFQQGLTKCLVGTRGLLGEGWDANKINVLIDLTTVTTSMSINQLRGRSFRLDPDWPNKTANNWDVICLASEFNKGFDDYTRFKNKHKNLYGVSDDGMIEKGVGHVHPAFTEIKPEGLEGTSTALNEEMLARSQHRDHIRKLWKIGQPFKEEQIHAVEIKFKGNGGGFPPFGKSTDPWSDKSLTGAIASAVIGAMNELGIVKSKKSLKAGSLSGGYVRVFLEGASPEDNNKFAVAMRQVMGPLDRPRYVIPRSVAHESETLLSNLLPEIIGKYFRKRLLRVAMLHAVPDLMAKRKSDVKIFEKHWNHFVSPGEALYAHRGKGEKLLEESKSSNVQPSTIFHEKEIFI